MISGSEYSYTLLKHVLRSCSFLIKPVHLKLSGLNSSFDFPRMNILSSNLKHFVIESNGVFIPNKSVLSLGPYWRVEKNLT